MKKAFWCVMVIFALGMTLDAQETKMAVGLGPEWNMNSRHNFAGGAVQSA